jgi:predicted transcriptional regulator of viral defense system
VLRLAKGKYLLIPLEAGPDSAWTEDSLVVACHLVDPACVAYWSACHYWNWTEQVPRTVFVQTTQKKMESARTVLGVRYQFVRVTERKFFGVVGRAAGRGQFIVTDREKTLVDALDRPDLCGGIGQVIAILRAAEPIDWDKVDRYLAKIGSGAIYKRLGFLAEHLGKRLRLPDRAARIADWRSRLTAGCAPLEPGGAATGRVNSRWRVRLNAPGTDAKKGRL